MKTRIERADGSVSHIDFTNPINTLNDIISTEGVPPPDAIKILEGQFQCKWNSDTKKFE